MTTILLKTLQDWGDMIPAYNQGDVRWSSERLGFGNKTIGSSGCLLTCFAMIADYYRGQRPHGEQRSVITPSRANQVCKDAIAFSGSGLLRSKAAAALQFTQETRVVAGNFGGVLKRAQERARPAILSIDYRTGASSGMSAGDHFVVLLGVLGEVGPIGGKGNKAVELLCIDPAGGKELLLRIEPNAEGGYSNTITYKQNTSALITEIVLTAP